MALIPYFYFIILLFNLFYYFRVSLILSLFISLTLTYSSFLFSFFLSFLLLSFLLSIFLSFLLSFSLAFSPNALLQQQKEEEKKNVDIDSAHTFLTMSTAEKREWVRSALTTPLLLPLPTHSSLFCHIFISFIEFYVFVCFFPLYLFFSFPLHTVIFCLLLCIIKHCCSWYYITQYYITSYYIIQSHFI